MEKYFLGVTERGLERRVKVEKQHAEDLAKVFVELEKQIKNTQENDGWQRLVLFSASNARHAVMFLLTRTLLPVIGTSEHEASKHIPPTVFRVL